MRVLVVDDYPDAAETACLLIGMLGHDCRAANSGNEALEEAARFDPEIVILDIGLPDMTGYEVARLLRERANGKPLHLAAVTGWGQPADRVRAYAAGFDQHILKPADAEKLKSILTAAGAMK